MIRECFKTQTGILFDIQALRRVGIDPRSLYPFVLLRPQARDVGNSRIQRRPHLSSDRPVSSAILSVPLRTGLVPFTPALPGIHGADGELKLGTEEEEELQDALSAKHDKLRIAKFWWLLEVLPLKTRITTADNKWITFKG